MPSWVRFQCTTASIFEILFGRVYFDPLFVQCICVSVQLLLLEFHTWSSGDEAPSEALLSKRVSDDNVVLGTKALIFLGLRHVIIVSPFEEAVGI